ncbi:hypothetical protein [Geobacillus thermoleovorans]|uniref:hypothetical protein n=2 Tax=Geobacillus TaxID=129337 RepID=UPI00049FD07F|nr:hypothetical protein DI44_17825 [Geobacillus sp. CAMR5420]
MSYKTTDTFIQFNLKWYNKVIYYKLKFVITWLIGYLMNGEWTSIMLKGLKISSLSSWLRTDVSESADKLYRHNLIQENKSFRANAIEDLKPVIRAAHDDARFRLRKAFQDNLDPLGEWDDDFDPADGYPEVFDLTTLKGYFGEFFSGVIAENFSPFGESNWQVPVFSFRWHDTAFDQLEMYRQTGQMKEAIMGRTGDDCVAFVLDKDRITKILFLEAKCTAKHDPSMIADAHTKISSTNLIPVEVRRIIEVLQDYKENTTAQLWIAALRQLYRPRVRFERYDCVSYVCGQSPVRKRSWIPPDAPHSNYTGGRKLEAVEIQLTDVEELIKDLYGKDD